MRLRACVRGPSLGGWLSVAAKTPASIFYEALAGASALGNARGTEYGGSRRCLSVCRRASGAALDASVGVSTATAPVLRAAYSNARSLGYVVWRWGRRQPLPRQPGHRAHGWRGPHPLSFSGCPPTQAAAQLTCPHHTRVHLINRCPCQRVRDSLDAALSRASSCGHRVRAIGRGRFPAERVHGSQMGSSSSHAHRCLAHCIMGGLRVRRNDRGRPSCRSDPTYSEHPNAILKRHTKK